MTKAPSKTSIKNTPTSKPDVGAPAASTSETKPVAQVQENLRKATEQGGQNGKTQYTKVKAVAKDTPHSLEASYAVVSKGVSELHAKALDAVRTNADHTFQFATALLAVKTPAEAFSVHQAHVRKQMETLTAQSQEFAALARKVATDSAEPLKAVLTKPLSFMS